MQGLQGILCYFYIQDCDTILKTTLYLKKMCFFFWGGGGGGGELILLRQGGRVVHHLANACLDRSCQWKHGMSFSGIWQDQSVLTGVAYCTLSRVLTYKNLPIEFAILGNGENRQSRYNVLLQIALDI